MTNVPIFRSSQTPFLIRNCIASFSMLASAWMVSGQEASDPAAPASAAIKCPVVGSGYESAARPDDFWPSRLDLSMLHQNSLKGSPMAGDFDYRREFAKLDLAAVKADLNALMTDSQDWWPADYGHYGPLFVRMAWHSAGTYRVTDGRGGASDGTQRFAPLNGWPDNANLDKARRLLWPIKQKYGQRISWADLMVLAGNVALESMGFETVGFAGGREDVWEPQIDVNWGPEVEMLADERYSGDRELENPLAAVQMGLIYVNPEGPNGKPDPVAAAKDIRETFARMAMNDEETVALIAGGHTFGKAHGAASPEGNVGPDPEAAPLQELGLGWINSRGTGHGKDTITSGLEGAWTSTPTEWSSGYFDNMFSFKWKLTKSPAGAWQWTPTDESADSMVPDAHDDALSHAPMMFTTDLALISDPEYKRISKRFHENPEDFRRAFAQAWFKLTHRDMGPTSRYLGPEVPEQQFIWQDPIPVAPKAGLSDADVQELKDAVLDTQLSVSDLVATAWASASSFRDSDKRGGANGARVRLAPQNQWAANNPRRLTRVLEKLTEVQATFNDSRSAGPQVSMADLIVLGGAVGIEAAAKEAGHDLTVPFTPGRTDASPEQTDVASIAVLEPQADGFRNFLAPKVAARPEALLIDRAQQLRLSAPEMTVLVGGLRVLGANTDDLGLGVLTDSPGQLTRDFFVNLLDMNTQWAVSPVCEHFYEGRDRSTNELKWKASAVDLLFGSHSQLRAIAEVYASEDSDQKFVDDFIAAWTKVMTLDRFELEAADQAAVAVTAIR